MASNEVSLLLFTPMDDMSSHRRSIEAPVHPSHLLALILQLPNTHATNITLQKTADYEGEGDTAQPSNGEDLI